MLLSRTLIALALVGVAAPAAHAAKPANANFKGRWTADTNGGWVIKKENLKTGVCSGTPSFKGYSLTGCKVTGHHYKFTVVYGAYRSVNSGTFHGNSAKGQFHDTNGTMVAYTATRK